MYILLLLISSYFRYFLMHQFVENSNKVKRSCTLERSYALADAMEDVAVLDATCGSDAVFIRVYWEVERPIYSGCHSNKPHDLSEKSMVWR
jgi:hypothetical protein